VIEKSNVQHISNVYKIKGDFRDDKEFQKKVRGKNNLYIMLKTLSGKSWIDGEAEVKDYLYLLTDIQRNEWYNTRCSILGNLEEKVHGYVERNGKYICITRCYKTDCKYFYECCPEYRQGDTLPLKPEAKVVSVQDKQDLHTSIELPDPEFLGEKKQVDEYPGTGINQRQSTFINFEEEPELPCLIENIAASQDDLTPNDLLGSAVKGQDVIIYGSPELQMLVQAGPGTGKTYSVLKKLEYMVDESRQMEANRILILCFTRAAVKEIKDRFIVEIKSGNLSDDLARIEIRTFDSFATRILIHMGIDTREKDYDDRIQMAIEVIQSQPDILEAMGHFIVDEIQDLVGVRARLVKTIIEHRPEECGFTLLGDSFQGIYDYQIKDMPGELDARGLLIWVSDRFGNNMTRVEMYENHRQTRILDRFSVVSRKLLEENDPRSFLNNIKGILPCGKEHNFPLSPGISETAGILCRSNGEVLKMSDNLRIRGIKHVVRKRRDNPLLPIWVTDILSINLDYLTLKELEELNNEWHWWIETDTFRFYAALETIAPANRGRLELKQIRRNLAGGIRLPDEYYEIEDEKIFISTIHQSKGREYDNVYLLEPWGNSAEEDLFEEAKVYYVAITRAKNQLKTVKTSSGIMKPMEFLGHERWTELGHKKGVRRLEIGIDNDIDEQSFVDSLIITDATENQEYIREKISSVDKVKLKREEFDGGYCYLITHKQRTIGRMSTQFTKQIEGFWVNHPPQIIEGVYVDRIYSIIKRPETLRISVKEPYFSSGIWYGVNILGLGKLRWDI